MSVHITRELFMKNLALGFVLGVFLSETVWAVASSPSMPSPLAQRTRPDQLWQQDRGAAIQRYQEQRQHDILLEHQFRKEQGDETLRRPC